MPLPQQVIDRLGQDQPNTPGWSIGILGFSGAILALLILIYVGLTFGYQPYLDGQIEQVNAEISTLAKSISPEDQARVATFYSQVTNIKSTLASHVFFSQFLAWLEKHTEANVYFSNFNFSAGNQIVFSAVAKTEADVNQQLAIFETAPEIKKVAITSVTYSDTGGTWLFSGALTVDPAAVLRLPRSL